MLKGHPKGLLVAFFANMGERFGFYVLIAVFVLFLQAKYGYSAATSGQIFGIFLFAVYFFPLIGGYLADKFLGYGKSVSYGLVIMFVGYGIISIPTKMDSGFLLVLCGLLVIALGTGMFKGNLQALVGNLYDDPKYESKRDVAFNIYYMGINIGAMFAPSVTMAISNFFLKSSGLVYNGAIPKLANNFLDGKTTFADTEKLAAYMESQIQFGQEVGVVNNFSDLSEFATYYINSLSEAYHYSFSIACVTLVLSMMVFWGFKKYYKEADITESEKAKDEKFAGKIVELSPKETRDRMFALIMVFLVVIFFWMSFHQNGTALTFFARDYTLDNVSRYNYFWFDVFGFLPLFLAIVGLYYAIRRNSEAKTRIIGLASAVILCILAYLRFQTYGDVNFFGPMIFQQFNPFFIVALTPLVIGVFSWLNKKNIEPSAPRKIGIGMLITTVAFLILIVVSLRFIGSSPGDLGETRAPEDTLVSPYWLISTFFVLTIAELFLSPMGISFVSKVAPPKYKGLMQGGWLAAVSIGNYAVGLIALLWAEVELWVFWAILTVCCLLAAAFIFSILKRLESISES